MLIPLHKCIAGVQAMLADYLGGSSSVAWKVFVQKIEAGCVSTQVKPSHTREWIDQVCVCVSVCELYVCGDGGHFLRPCGLKGCLNVDDCIFHMKC